MAASPGGSYKSWRYNSGQGGRGESGALSDFHPALSERTDHSESKFRV